MDDGIYRCIDTKVSLWPTFANNKAMKADDEPAPPRRSHKMSAVDHTYYDYSKIDGKTIAEAGGDVIGVALSAGERPTKKKKKKSTFVSFPMKLHMILSDPKNHDIIRWGPHGRTWNIYDKKGLEDVCREHFKHDSFASFNRSVNGWGFKVRMFLFLFLLIEARHKSTRPECRVSSL